MGNEPRICLADDDATALESTARLVRAGGYSVVLCQSQKCLFQAVNGENFLCIVVESNMLEVDELNFLPLQQHGVPVIFTARVATVAAGVEAMKAGAIDFLIKPLNSDRLIRAIREATQRYQRSLELTSALRKFSLLTQREKEVFEFVAIGMMNKQIAARLGISEKTIKVHRGRVMGKMKARSIAELVRLSDKLAPAVKLPSNTPDVVTRAPSCTPVQR